MDSPYDQPFNVSPRDVLANAGQTQNPSGLAYSAQQQQMQASGMDPLAMVAPYFSGYDRQGGGSAGGMGGPMMRETAGQRTAETAEAKRQSNPFFGDANFYANAVGDLGAAQTLMTTKDGRSAFQMFEAYDFDLGGGDPKNPNAQSGSMKMRIVPRGSRQITTPDGRMADIPVWDLARRSGVTTVAFRGGDEQAEQFRGTIARAQGLLKSLAQLEEHYNKNSILTGYGTSEASTLSRGLESKILMDYGAVMNGLKGVGGSVSETDMELIKSMTPQRASAWWTRLGGNEKALLKQVRSQVLDKLKDTARVNGLELLPESNSHAKQLNESNLLRKSKSFD